jgi:hypothetical protein
LTFRGIKTSEVKQYSSSLFTKKKLSGSKNNKEEEKRKGGANMVIDITKQQKNGYKKATSESQNRTKNN